MKTTKKTIPSSSKREKRKFIPAKQEPVKVIKEPIGKSKKLRAKTWKEVKEGIPLPMPYRRVETIKGKTYPARSDHPVFVARWFDLIDDVACRENFHDGHLSNLEILCNLYVEHEMLQAFVRENGFSYEVEEGRNGPQIKYYPEVNQLNRTRAEIRSFSHMLGIILSAEEGEKASGDGWDDE